MYQSYLKKGEYAEAKGYEEVKDFGGFVDVTVRQALASACFCRSRPNQIRRQHSQKQRLVSLPAPPFRS